MNQREKDLQELSRIIKVKDKDAVEMSVCEYIENYKQDDEVLLLICEIFKADWHFRHEDIALSFQHIRNPITATALFENSFAQFEYDNWNDNYPMQRKCTWALADIGTQKAKEYLIQIKLKANSKVASFAIKRLINWENEIARKGQTIKNKKYIFKSERLGFRNWSTNDLNEFSEINSDTEVMEYFPTILSKKETEDFIQRLINHYDKKGYNYFATEILKTGELIGFIGLADQSYETDFNPATDIGWRLKKTAWGKGYATEGAKRCLAYAFNELNINTIISTCTIQNKNSENIMKKIGMTKKGEFKHPKLKSYPNFEKCIWYEIKQDTTQATING